ncbi:hypothetical protein ACGFNU_40515 [Spirillospora sp. NPDC048911]|uniref:hypothetical protein n=1 Tax=Spirillospora sp. NPDC048911 TaxID=3364527 RepID=UPI003721E9C0
MATVSTSELTMIVKGQGARLDDVETQVDALTRRVVSLQEGQALTIKAPGLLLTQQGLKMPTLTDQEIDEVHDA